jgi:hypothetical protein
MEIWTEEGQQKEKDKTMTKLPRALDKTISNSHREKAAHQILTVTCGLEGEGVMPVSLCCGLFDVLFELSLQAFEDDPHWGEAFWYDVADAFIMRSEDLKNNDGLTAIPCCIDDLVNEPQRKRAADRLFAMVRGLGDEGIERYSLCCALFDSLVGFSISAFKERPHEGEEFAKDIACAFLDVAEEVKQRADAMERNRAAGGPGTYRQ